MTLASKTLNIKVTEERDIYATSWLDRSRDIFLNHEHALFAIFNVNLIHSLRVWHYFVLTKPVKMEHLQCGDMKYNHLKGLCHGSPVHFV